MLKFGLGLLFCLAVPVLSQSETTYPLDNIDKEYGIYILNDANFAQAITRFRNLLVWFYSPLDQDGDNFRQEYRQTAREISPINTFRLAEINTQHNPDVVKMYGILRTPTLKFFRNGTAEGYTGGKTYDSLMNWLYQNTEDYKLANVDDPLRP